MLKRVKNIVSIIGILVISFCAVLCLYLLNSEAEFESNYDLNQAELEVDKQYSKVFLAKETLRKTEKISGQVCSQKGDFIVKKTFAGELNDVKRKQGQSFVKNDVIFSNAYETFRADFDGKVDRIIVEKGNVYVDMVNYENRYVSIQVPTNKIKYLKTNQNVKVLYNKKKYDGQLMYIASFADGNNVAVKIKLEDKKMNVLIGAIVEVSIIIKEVKNALSVPREALIESGDTYYVHRLDEKGNSDIVEVIIGITTDDNDVEIKSGLKESDVVLIDSLGGAN